MRIVSRTQYHFFPTPTVTYHEEKNHRLPKRAEVIVLVQATMAIHVHEKRHTEYGKYEHDEKQQQTNVEQRRERHGQSEQ